MAILQIHHMSYVIPWVLNPNCLICVNWGDDTLTNPSRFRASSCGFLRPDQRFPRHFQGAARHGGLICFFRRATVGLEFAKNAGNAWKCWVYEWTCEFSGEVQEWKLDFLWHLPVKMVMSVVKTGTWVLEDSKHQDPKNWDTRWFDHPINGLYKNHGV